MPYQSTNHLEHTSLKILEDENLKFAKNLVQIACILGVYGKTNPQFYT